MRFLAILAFVSISASAGPLKLTTARVLGKVEATAECSKGTANFWYSAGKILLYQAEVPVGGTFEIYSNPGKYSIVVTGASGCMATQNIELKPATQSKIVLNLSPVAPSRKAAFFPGIPSAEADYWCPTCNMMINNSAPSLPSLPTMYAPYGSSPLVYSPDMTSSSYYGATNYPNYSWPAAWQGNGFQNQWSGNGFNGPAYPPAFGPMRPLTSSPSGGMMDGSPGTNMAWLMANTPGSEVGGFNGNSSLGNMNMGIGKPNVYVSGPTGSEIKIQVKLPGDSFPWVGVPSHESKGWSAKIASDGALVSDGVKYPYFFYDFRATEGKLQDQAGFCSTPEAILPRLLATLTKAGFQKREVQDFKDYWAYKLPSSEEYCVFPQMTAELDRIAKLEITPAPSRLTRLTFVIVPKEWRAKPEQKFANRPKKEWIAPDDKQRKIASDATEVREWGVGFLKAN